MALVDGRSSPSYLSNTGTETSPAAVNSTGLHLLPNELLLRLIEELDVTPYTLMTVSRELNARITSIYFFNSRNRLCEVAESGLLSVSISVRRMNWYGYYFHANEKAMSSFHHDKDELDTLALAFDIRNIHSLTFRFPPYHDVYPPSLWPRYRQLSATISRFARLDHIRLIFESRLDYTEFVKEDHMIWRTTLRSILDASIDKGCISLHVQGGMDPHDYRHSDVITLSNQTQTQAQFQDSHLQTLTISAPFLLLPSFLYWTHHLISASHSLTTLIVHGVNLNPPSWTVAFDWLHRAVQSNKTLTIFKISLCEGVPITPLYDFLSGTKQVLMELTLLIPVIYPENSHRNAFGLKVALKPRTKFRRVTKLRVTSGMLGYMTGVKWKGNGLDKVLKKVKEKFPMLEKVTVEDGGTVVKHTLTR